MTRVQGFRPTGAWDGMMINERQKRGGILAATLDCPPTRDDLSLAECYWVIELATAENTLLAFPPIKRIVPTTMTRITASMTAYSAIS
jgi:hypothetical protein